MCQASEKETDVWKDSFFRSMDDEEFGIKACFNNMLQKQFLNKSSHNYEDKKTTNLSFTPRYIII